MKHEKLGITFRSDAWFAMWRKPEGDALGFDRQERGLLAGADPDALSRFEGEGGREAPDLPPRYLP